jgi:hypothetical protein
MWNRGRSWPTNSLVFTLSSCCYFNPLLREIQQVLSDLRIRHASSPSFARCGAGSVLVSLAHFAAIKHAIRSRWRIACDRR